MKPSLRLLLLGSTGGSSTGFFRWAACPSRSLDAVEALALMVVAPLRLSSYDSNSSSSGWGCRIASWYPKVAACGRVRTTVYSSIDISNIR